MKISPAVRNIIFIWLAWAMIMLGFQSWVSMRIDLKRPDNVLFWTASETGVDSNNDQPYLIDPFLNSQVAWDSEFYLAIADQGYDATQVRAIPDDFVIRRFFCRADVQDNCYSLSYAFFPVYPLLIRLFSLPLQWLPLTRIAVLTLAAVIVSLFGALVAMLSLYSMTRSSLGEKGGIRAAFYFLIFPSSFFLAQVYSEGVFIGITFAALAFLVCRKYAWAALFAALAVWTRPGGALLVIPMVVVWIMEKTWRTGWKTTILRSILVLSPVISYGIWRLTPLADKFFIVENNFFGRGLLLLDKSLKVWQQAWGQMINGAPPTRFYYGLEFSAILLGIICCILLIRSRPEIALFGLAMIFFSLTSGSAQGMVRYILVAPPIFMVLARWGDNHVFDRAWTLLSILILSLEVILFSFDFWVA